MANAIWNPGINSTNPTVELIVNQQSQSIDGNYSVLAYSLILHRPGNIISSASKSYSVTINGVTVASGSTTIGGSGDKTIVSGTTTVYHNADGTKTGVGFSFAMTIGITWSGVGTGNASGSGSMNLTTIPRASSIPSISGGALGSPVTVNISRASGSFTHTVIYKRTDGVEVTVGTGQETSCTFTPSLSDADFLPNSTSGTATIIVHTYNGSTYIGTASKTFTVTVPSSVVPTVSIVKSGVDLYQSQYVQGKSKVEVTLNANGAYKSTIQTRSTLVRAGSVNISLSTANNFTSGILNYSGTITIETTVTDSRGRSASASTTISVVAYSSARVVSFSAYRCNANGTANPQGAYLKMEGSSLISAINNTNLRTTILRYREKGTTNWTDGASNTTSYNPTLSAVVAADVNKSYEAQIYLFDHFGNASNLVNVGTAFVLLDFHQSGNSMAIGKVSEGNALLEVGGNILLDGMISNLNIGRKTSTSALILADANAWAELPLMKGVMINPSGTAGLPESQYYYVVKIAMRDMVNGYGGIAINYSTGDFYTFVSPSGTMLPAFTFIGPQ